MGPGVDQATESTMMLDGNAEGDNMFLNMLAEDGQEYDDPNFSRMEQDDEP